MYHKRISYDDFQSKNLPDPIDTNDIKLMKIPKLINLTALVELVSRRNRNIVLRYHKPNKEIHPEKCAYCLLILSYPFTDEKQLVVNRSHVSKLNEENVLQIINPNKCFSQIQASLTIMFTRYIKKEIRTKMIITL